MKTFTFKLESEKDAMFSDAETQTFKEREAEYHKNPNSAIKADDLENKLKRKYAFCQSQKA